MLAEMHYTTQLQAGLGMVPECMALLRLHEPGMTSPQLEEKALADGLFSGCTARTVRNRVAEMFVPRFYRPDSAIADRLKQLLDLTISIDVVRQIFLLHTARAQRVLHDFVCSVYWPRQRQGVDFLGIDQARDFLLEATRMGRLNKPWSPITIQRVSGYITSTCHDFELLGKGKGGKRPVQHFRLRNQTALYLAHDLHFSGVGDTSLVHHPDWALYGRHEPEQVLATLHDLAAEGHLLVQSGAGLVQISWKYPTWKEAIVAIAR